MAAFSELWVQQYPVPWNSVEYRYGYANMKLALPDGWKYSVEEYREGEYTFNKHINQRADIDLDVCSFCDFITEDTTENCYY